MYISLYDLGLLILFVLALTVAYYLIVALKGIIGVTRQVGSLIDANQQSLGQTLEALPPLLENSNELVVSACKAVDTANSAVACIEDNLADTADKVQESVDTALLYARCAAEVAKAVVGVFSKSTDK